MIEKIITLNQTKQIELYNLLSNALHHIYYGANGGCPAETEKSLETWIKFLEKEMGISGD